MAAKSASDDQLRALATARADALRDTLTREHGVGDRVTVGDVQVDREQGRAGVGVSLGGG